MKSINVRFLNKKITSNQNKRKKKNSVQINFKYIKFQAFKIRKEVKIEIC